ncbi:unnamed protein product [Leptosia nina]|uniref:Uncharacterized protein n=1 Tax=Leptosia nina TaxID=320188 RepID=A0AAV1JSE8_9NEOP
MNRAIVPICIANSGSAGVASHTLVPLFTANRRNRLRLATESSIWRSAYTSARAVKKARKSVDHVISRHIETGQAQQNAASRSHPRRRAHGVPVASRARGFRRSRGGPRRVAGGGGEADGGLECHIPSRPMPTGCVARGKIARRLQVARNEVGPAAREARQSRLRGGRGGARGLASEGGGAVGRELSVVRLESRRPAVPRGAIHVPRALVIVNLIRQNFKNNN